MPRLIEVEMPDPGMNHYLSDLLDAWNNPSALAEMQENLRYEVIHGAQSHSANELAGMCSALRVLHQRLH